MTTKTVVHYLAHSCGPQECDCVPICNGRLTDPAHTSDQQRVTCKTCFNTLETRRAKAVAASESSKIAYKAELYDEVWSLAISHGFANVTDAIMAAAKAKS